MMKKLRKANNTISNLDARFLHQLEKKVDVEGLSLIDLDDIHRVRSGDVDSDDDQIIFSEKARKQTLRAFKSFGFERLPKTVIEFEAIYEYCLLLRSGWCGARGSLHEQIAKRSALATFAASFTQYLDSATAYFNDDLLSLTKIHRNPNFIALIVREYCEEMNGDAA